MARVGIHKEAIRFNGVGGYTLIELLIVLAIVAILVSSASPFLTSILNDNRLASQFNQLLGSLQFARAEAIRRQTSVTVCSSSDGASCGGNWEDGWITLAQGAVVKSTPELAGNTTLRFNRTGGSASDRILFDSRGFSLDYSGTWTLCDSRGATNARGLNVVAMGRVVRARDTDSDGIVEDIDGSALSCP
ncbi:MAG: GspH/FimT family pseudopilin [Magnetococcales bacterium]|nr:GspH/FimT family pseudopilin [Magnetococcales bacterium]